MNNKVRRMLNEVIRFSSDKDRRSNIYLGEDGDCSMDLFINIANKKEQVLKVETRNNGFLGQVTRCVVKGDILSNNETKVEECGFTENTILNVVTQIIKVKVECYDGRTFFIEVYKNDKLVYVKKKIKKIIRFNKDEHRLEYNGSVLKNDDNGEVEGGMSERSIFRIVEKLKNGTLKKFEMINGRKIILDIKKSDKILDIKEKIKYKMKLLINGIRLVIDDVELKDSQTIEDCNVWNKTCITILLRQEFIVYVQCINGFQYILYVTKEDTIFDLKKKLEGRIELPLEEQKIIYNEKILEDDLVVGDCDFSDGCLIKSRRRLIGEIQITLKTWDGTTRKLEVSKEETIYTIKTKIRRKIGLHSKKQSLVYKGKVLDDDDIVESYGINSKSIIHVTKILSRSSGIRIYIHAKDGRNTLFHVIGTDTIFELKNMIQEKMRILSCTQKLVFQGVQLEDHKTINYYELYDNSYIMIEERPRGGNLIYVKTSNDKIFTIEMLEEATISDIKKKIQEKTSFTPEKQKLLYQERILEDDKTAEECQLYRSSSTNAVLILKNYFIINIKLEYGKSFSLGIFLKDEVIDIKNHIFEYVWLPVIDQIVLYQGKPLDNYQTSRECGFVEDCEVKVEILRRNIKIKIDEVYGKTSFEMTISNLCKVREVKERIDQCIGVPLKYQDLWSGRCKMEDNEEMLCFCNVTEGSVIKLYRKITIHVHPNDMESFSLKVNKTDNILDVKKKIQEKTSFYAEDQILMHQKELIIDHNDSVEQINIPENNSMVVTAMFKSLKIRGICVIINNENFDGIYKRRTGTEKDEENIRKTFELMGYEIKIYRDVLFHDMNTIIDQIREKVSNHHKMLITFILSYGVKEGIICSDEKLFTFKNILKPFSNKNFPKLFAKPKLFFFTCCRWTLNNKMASSSNIQNDVLSDEEDTRVPFMSDFFLGFETCEDYKSCRDEIIGTPYITHLCEVIRKNPLWSISDIHQEVQRKESEVEIKDNECQVPCSENILRKHAYFLTIDEPITN